MILKTALLIKVLLVLAAGTGIFWLLRKYCNKKRAVLFACCVAIIGAFLGQTAASFVPPLTDTVTITALGEKNPGSNACEVALVDFKVDKEAYAIGEIVSGKWFWFGSQYMWRPETDTRQPEGTTRTIQVEVPVGWARTVNFSTNIWRGTVMVEHGGQTQTVDLYTEADGVKSVSIVKSATSRLILNQIRCLAAYAGAVLLLSAFVIGISTLSFKKPEKTRAWFASHRSCLLIGVIALAQLAFAIHYSGIDCFWLDELFEIGWSTITDSLSERAFMGTAPLPLFATFAGLWYEIAPYGERWLLLPFELITAVGIFFVGMAGKELRGDLTGVFSAILAAISSTVLSQCSHEIRSYGFYFAGAALVLFLFLRHIRRRKEEGWKAVVGLGFAMIFFAGMHYHAVFSCILLFLIDLLFLVCIDRFSMKLGVRLIVPYVMAAASYLPNIFNILASGKLSAVDENTWQPKPTYSKVAELFDFFSGNSDMILFFFVVGLAVAIVFVLYALCGKNKTSDVRTLQLAVPVLWLTVIVAFFVIYGNYRYNSGISSLWNSRYFCSLLPAFFVLGAVGASSLAAFVKKALGGDARGFWIVVLLFCLLVVPSSAERTYARAHSVRQPYRAAADWLYSQGNYVYNDNTLVIDVNEDVDHAACGWSEYYLTKQGQRDPINFLHYTEVDANTLRQYDRIYVQYVHRSSVPSSLQKLLDEQFVLEATHANIKTNVYVRK